MDLSLAGKVVLVTGGSKGIGLACARLFVEEGARVAICARSVANALPGAFGVAADLSDAAQAEAMIDAVEARLGPIDVLVNSAGAAKRSPPDALTPDFWRAAMDAKFFTTINAVDPLVKRMAQRGRGVIVNIIGVGGKTATSTHLAGGAANAALMLATAGLGAAYAGKGVRVVGVSPGLTDTTRVAEGMIAEAHLMGTDVAQALLQNLADIPMGRLATPEEIANAVAFLASDKASYVTGVTLVMDGGKSPTVV
ncbi:3-oxoacyl-ACP reductase [Rhodoblastus sphagnicola]|uniref:3-oxoacyl-ACP reductase n=1 Tax=Rhodoblastus sphagnicola TaxID=333368 RepID=A0A2S6MX36_9HYPH|nr:SDR family oxidoreductase [Rhodoblastus sphagnicola]MBB4199256.1 NAD(P)-dependent dehydrogenase (short-subunit alcohol dehydrogenase family) [Rhodoblastus sphagnicola]PPQ26925.1 3-oxoacyl-ACP reductase [Rhodoblastus sphagnicola]